MLDHFEKETCTRCGGTGKFSYCEGFGDTCFKCLGKTITLTKRGRAAYEFYVSLLKVPMSEIKVGDFIAVEGMTHSYKAEVIGFEKYSSGMSYMNGIATEVEYYKLSTTHCKYGSYGLVASLDTLVRVYRSDDIDRKRQALEFQSTLNKNGEQKNNKLSK